MKTKIVLKNKHTKNEVNKNTFPIFPAIEQYFPRCMKSAFRNAFTFNCCAPLIASLRFLMAS